jgi:glucose-1-phosphate adenylyltransferase
MLQTERQLQRGYGADTTKVVAMVLGGGRGTRLHPLTAERAKPAVPLGGRYRLVDIPLSNCVHSRINQIYVFTQFNSVSLNRHINSTFAFDPFASGFVEVLAAEQTETSGNWFQGTADAIRQHLKHVSGAQADHYLVLSGDQLYRMDYRDMLKTHLDNGADITVSTLPVLKDACAGFGVLRARPDGRITEFVEKPTSEDVLERLKTPAAIFEQFGIVPDGRDYLASMGVYLFKREVLESILLVEPTWIDFGKDVIPNSLDSYHVQAHLFEGFWEDIGTIGSYYRTSIEIAGPNPQFRFHENGLTTFTRPRYLPGARIGRAEITNSIICEGSVIDGAAIRDSIIGIRTPLKKNTVIEESVLMGADYFEGERRTNAKVPIGIGEGSHVSGAIIDKNAHIGKNVVIRGCPEGDGLVEGDGWVMRDGVVVVLKDAVIPNSTVIDFSSKA